MLKILVTLIVLTLGVSASLAAPACCAKAAGGAGAEKGDCWMLGTQAYTFRLFTLFEAIDKAKELGLKYIEIFPGQKLSKETPDVKVGHDLPVSTLAKIKVKLDEAGVKAVAYGVVRLGTDEAENRQIFDFAKVMNIKVINTEPPEEALPLIDKLANEYGISVAIHNHPAPSHYWNPETVAKAIKNLSPRVGACADTGHWVRSGLDPVECLKKLEGRILWSHFKDLNKKAPDAHDVPWGTGVGNMKAQLAEFKRQGFTGGFSVEYEHNWENSMPEIAKCVEFFNKTTEELCKPAEGK